MTPEVAKLRIFLLTCRFPILVTVSEFYRGFKVTIRIAPVRASTVQVLSRCFVKKFPLQ